MQASIRTVRKQQRKSAIDDNKTLIEMGLKASRQAVQQAFDAGVAITVIENGRLITVDAENHKTELKKVAGKPQQKLRELLCQD